MAELADKRVRSILHNGVEFEVVERPAAIWVGCVEYAANNLDEPDIGAALKRYREELIDVPKKGLVHPDWSAALSINYTVDTKPCGLMFAQETGTEEQDARYDVYKSPASLYMRVKFNADAVEKLLGRECMGCWEFFSIIKDVMGQYGYTCNADGLPEIEFYGLDDDAQYAYVPVTKAAG